ncbi:MAG: hypothetical protein ACI8RZ_000116 [Myxococcota bacterium]|jgi:hypothetical protein
MSLMLLIGLVARADSGIDVVELIAEMTASVGEVEELRRDAEGEPEVARCVEKQLVSMRALLELATRAQAASTNASSEGKADLEDRKVMVAASRHEALRLQAWKCQPERTVILDCPECPPDVGITDAPGEEDVIGPQVPEDEVEDTDPPDTETWTGSPFE